MVTVLETCPNCGSAIGRPTVNCPKCGIIFAKWTPERRKVDASPVFVSTTSMVEPFETIGPVYAVTTNANGILERAATTLGIDAKGVTSFELLHALNAGGATQGHEALPTAFAVCVEHLRRAAASLGANAVIGVQMNFHLDHSAGGPWIFTMQLIGTAIRWSKSRRYERKS